MLIYFYGSLDSKKIENIFSENIGTGRERLIRTRLIRSST